MHLIDVTNTYRHLVEKRLSTTDSKYVKVYSLGNTTVVYSDSNQQIEAVLENKDRQLRDEEIEFVIKRLFPKNISYDLTVDVNRHVIAITALK